MITPLSADAIVSAANLTAGIWLGVLAAIAFIYSTKVKDSDDTDTRIMLVGIGCEALGWAIHRLYWGAVRRIRDDVGDWFYLAFSNTWIVQVAAFSLVMAGLILILTPVWKVYIGRGWRVIPAALVLSTFWFFLTSEFYVDFSHWIHKPDFVGD